MKNLYIKYIIVFSIICLCMGLFLINRPPKNTLKIGVLVPSTGNFAVLGERMKNGFEMAKKDLIEKGEIDDIEIIYEDACQPKEAVSAVQKMISVDHITMLGGSFCVVGFVPSIPLLEQAHIVTFNTAPNPDVVLHKPYVVSTNSSIHEKAAQIGTFAANTLHGKTAAVIYYNTPLGIDYDKYLSETFEKQEGKVLIHENTKVDATDFRTELLKIKQLQPDILFVVQLAKPLGNLLTQAKELGIKATIVGNSQNEDPSIIATAGKAAEGFIISSDEPFPKTPSIINFTTRYKQTYGQEADVFAANAYDSLFLQVAVYKKCRNKSDCLLKELHSVKEYQGVSGSITIQPDGSASKPTIFKTVKNGKFEKIVN